MNIMIRGIAIAVLLGGGGLGLVGGAQADCSAVMPEHRNMYLPWICAIDYQSPSSAAPTMAETVTWRVTFSEPISRFSDTEFDFDETTNPVTGNSGHHYGTGSSTAAFTKVSGGDGSRWDISFTWECTTSDNDCQHNYDETGNTPGDVVGTARYEGTVTLVLSGSGNWQRTNSNNTGTVTHPNVTLDKPYEVR